MARKQGKPERVELGGFYLEQRADNGVWCIAWYDDGARCRRRRSTGIRGGDPQNPPTEARDALAKHYLECRRPAEPEVAAEALVSDLLTAWMREHVDTKKAPDRYKQSVPHLLEFFKDQKRTGHVKSGVMVADVNDAFVKRFIAYRKRAGVGGHTISRDIAALRGALNHAWRTERIASVPHVRDVAQSDKAKPRDRTLSMEEVAALLEQAAAYGCISNGGDNERAPRPNQASNSDFSGIDVCRAGHPRRH